jgi:hypothetical protein
VRTSSAETGGCSTYRGGVLRVEIGAKLVRWQGVAPISEWIGFFQALACLAHGDGHREIYCAVGKRYVVFSKTPIERKPMTAPKQRDLFDHRKADR